MNQIAVGECIRFGWNTFKKRPFMIIGVFVIAMIVSGVSSSLLDPGEGAPITATTILMGLASLGVGLLVEIGLVTFSIRTHDSVETVRVQDLWNPKPFLWYLISQILVGISVVVGLVLLIVPGVFLALSFIFSSYLIVDKGRGPIEAIKESWNMTKGHKWRLLLLIMTVIGLNILGLLALLVGLLVTIPVSMLAIVHAYRALERNAQPVSVA